MAVSSEEKDKQGNKESDASGGGKGSPMRLIQLWRLPDDFFSLETAEEQRQVFESIILKEAPTLGDQPRKPCRMSMVDDGICVIFFLTTLGLPILLAAAWIGVLVSAPFYFRDYGPGFYTTMIGALLIITAFLSLHPIPHADKWRQSRLSMALIRYFSTEILLDVLTIEERTQQLVSKWTKSTMTSKEHQKEYLQDLLPLVCLACPHGVFNYGAIVWCCISRWIVGYEQYTGAAGIIPYVPGLRYMAPLIWGINADRKSIQQVLRMQQKKNTNKNNNDDDNNLRLMYANGGMLGMVPDGILGAFQCKEGIDELHLGNKRGLMRICLQEGATIMAAWLFGTTDLLTVVQDPFGILQYLSRKMQAGMMLVYGRWFLPVPRRVPVTLCGFVYQVPQKIENPSREEVEDLHQTVYDGLTRVYEQQKTYAGYSHRTLHIT